MAQLFRPLSAKPGPEDALLAGQADTEGRYGNVRSARELTLRGGVWGVMEHGYSSALRLPGFLLSSYLVSSFIYVAKVWRSGL